MGYDLDELFATLRTALEASWDNGFLPEHRYNEKLHELDWLEGRIRLMREMGYA